MISRSFAWLSRSPYRYPELVAQMKIVIISDWFAERMGYAENCLPKAIALLEQQVHLVTSNVQPYFDLPEYKETYEPFIGPGVVACETRQIDGYTLHRLPYAKIAGRLRIQGLGAKLDALRPQIVQTFDAFSWTTVEAALARAFLGYRLFLESHLHASVFPPLSQPTGIRQQLKWRIYAATLGRWISAVSEKCYPISPDAAEIAVRFLGIQRQKIQVCSLGVDTDLFKPAQDESSQQARLKLRAQLGFAPTDIVCIYTGRFSADKDPLCLARAIDRLFVRGEAFRGLFVGNGTEAQVNAIRAHPGCITHPFVPVQALPPFYRAADIGVWPRQESTSQLDAAACGLPIILSNRVQVRERVDGNGLVYAEGDPDDLARQIHSLAHTEIRRQMSEIGVRRMRERFSWNRIARERVDDYQVALERQRAGK